MSLLLRPALYYPHVRFRDEAWLKEALLSFRQLRRMMPGGWQPLRDVGSELREVEIAGLGPMIMEEPIDQSWSGAAQRRLHDWVCTRPLAAFDRDHARAEYGSEDSFQMHKGKFLWELFAFLEEHGLVWTPRTDMRGLGRPVALHPRLGEAIMSVMAIAIAQGKQLNIVTSEPRIHHALLTRREEDVFASLAVKDDDPDPKAAAHAPDDLASRAAQLIIHKHLDLSWVTLEDIVAIVRDGNDFQRFLVRLQGLARELGLSATLDSGEQVKQVHALADAARTEWDAYRRSLGSFARIYVATALEDKTEAAIAASVSGAAGYSSLGLTSLGFGLVIGALTVGSKALKKLVQRRKDDPYRYLSRLAHHGATLVADFADD